MTISFAVTWDYRCPFARNAHDHLVTALEGGADWDVTFLAFALGQGLPEAGEASAFDAADRSGLLANEAGIVVRDRFPDSFLVAHHALFEARHAGAVDLRRRESVSSVLASVGLDGDAVLAEVDDGWPREIHRKEHIDAVLSHEVFGVPTFILGGEAAFVRLMDRASGDAALGTRTIERILDLLGGWPALNEFKHPALPF